MVSQNSNISGIKETNGQCKFITIKTMQKKKLSCPEIINPVLHRFEATTKNGNLFVLLICPWWSMLCWCYINRGQQFGHAIIQVSSLANSNKLNDVTMTTTLQEVNHLFGVSIETTHNLNDQTITKTFLIKQ